MIGVHHPGGSPRCDVRWAEDSRVTRHFPGPDACVRHLRHEPVRTDPQADEPSAPCETAAPRGERTVIGTRRQGGEACKSPR
ncbi:DUF1918 domain-containing protein [Streptomyces antnestii]|uniref:DUF1918 domain-containing protein n=1 Tax=Streptomyces antnestii TaxID=2494256 RepID=A0A437PKH0_9ACTN|nr:DUF1918 domain-containing protein [Streptomyces sp. San01]